MDVGDLHRCRLVRVQGHKEAYIFFGARLEWSDHSQRFKVPEDRQSVIGRE